MVDVKTMMLLGLVFISLDRTDLVSVLAESFVFLKGPRLSLFGVFERRQC